MHYGSGLLNLVATGGKAAQDGADLVRVDAPHTRKTKGLRSLTRRRFNRHRIAQFGHHAMRRHFAMRVAGAGNFHFCAQHQGVVKLVQCSARPAQRHGRSRYGAAMGGYKIHQAKTHRLHTRVRRNIKDLVQCRRRLDEHMDRQANVPSLRVDVG